MTALEKIRNSELTPEEFEWYSGSDFFLFRALVALREDCPIHILEFLAQDKHDSVLCCVGHNPNTPSNVLNYLSQKESVIIRASVARNINIKKCLPAYKRASEDVDYVKEALTWRERKKTKE